MITLRMLACSDGKIHVFPELLKIAIHRAYRLGYCARLKEEDVLTDQKLHDMEELLVKEGKI